jgi:RNA polymerase sigma factor (sigma-70 family)
MPLVSSQLWQQRNDAVLDFDPAGMAGGFGRPRVGTNAQSGDQQAMASLLEKYHPLVCKLALRVGGNQRSAEWDDLVQAGTCGLWRAIERFTCERGVQFMTFAWECVRNAVSAEVKSLRGRFSTVSLDDQPFGDGATLADLTSGDDPMPAEMAVRREESRELNVLFTLTRRGQVIVARRLAGEKFRAIATDLGVSTQRVWAIYAKGISRLEDKQKYIRPSSWSLDEIAVLSANRVRGWTHCASLLPNRSIHAVRCAAARLKIPKYRHLDQAGHDRIRELHALGWSTGEIGRAVGRSGETIRMLCKGWGLPSNSHNARWRDNPKRKEAVRQFVKKREARRQKQNAGLYAWAIALYQSGLTLQQVGARMGRSWMTIRGWLIRADVPRRKQGTKTAASIAEEAA